MFILILKDYTDDYKGEEYRIRKPQIFLNKTHLIEELFKIIMEEAEQFINDYYDDNSEQKLKELNQYNGVNNKDEEYIKIIKNLYLKGDYANYIFDYEYFEVEL